MKYAQDLVDEECNLLIAPWLWVSEWSPWFSSDHSIVAKQGLRGQLRASRKDLVTGGAKSFKEAIYAGPAVLQRWLVHPASSVKQGI